MLIGFKKNSIQLLVSAHKRSFNSLTKVDPFICDIAIVKIFAPHRIINQVMIGTDIFIDNRIGIKQCQYETEGDNINSSDDSNGINQ